MARKNTSTEIQKNDFAFLVLHIGGLGQEMVTCACTIPMR
jgi:hypothetical protein